jgi:heme/copper-type cytochrome/quinol oxidase subunit 4
LGEWNWQKFYTELKYIVSIGITLVGVTIIMNQELTKAKAEGVVTEVARMGQQIVHIIMNQELTKAKVKGVVTEVA